MVLTQGKSITSTSNMSKSISFSQLLQCSIANWFIILQMKYLCKYKRLFPYTLLIDYSVNGYYFKITSNSVFLKFYTLKKSSLVTSWYMPQNPSQNLKIRDQHQIFSYPMPTPSPTLHPKLVFLRTHSSVCVVVVCLVGCFCKINSFPLKQCISSNFCSYSYFHVQNLPLFNLVIGPSFPSWNQLGNQSLSCNSIPVVKWHILRSFSFNFLFGFDLLLQAAKLVLGHNSAILYIHSPPIGFISPLNSINMQSLVCLHFQS